MRIEHVSLIETASNVYEPLTALDAETRVRVPEQPARRHSGPVPPP